jgi:hypothetical protein
MANQSKRKTSKRKASSVTTPSFTILKYFKKATQIMSRNQSTFDTPSTVASNDLQTSPITPQEAAVMDPIANDSGDQKCESESGSPRSSAHLQHSSIQTPPSPKDDFVAETPPSPQSELMSVESPPTGLVSECENAAHYVVKSGGTQFGTPTSSDNEAEFGTPPTHDKDSIDKENGAAVDRVTNSNSTFQSAASGTNNRQINKSDKPRKKSQMYLDLGQKSFASHKICPICSSLIVHGTVEDQQNHIQICKSFKEGVTCLGFKKERCVGRFGEERILEIRENDSVGKKKVEEVKRIVDGELGFAVSSKSKLDKQNDLLQGMTSYLYIAKKRIVGLLLVKRINKAYELLHEKADGRTSSISRDTKPHPVIMGVHQIWVHNLHRHKGIATKLLECARGSFTFGMVIPIKKLAFSSPTEDGVGLAKRFVGVGEKVLVYDVC